MKRLSGAIISALVLSVAACSANDLKVDIGSGTISGSHTASSAELQQYGFDRLAGVVETVTIAGSTDGNSVQHELGFKVTSCTSQFGLKSNGQEYDLFADDKPVIIDAASVDDTSTVPVSLISASLLVQRAVKTPESYGCDAAKLQAAAKKVGITDQQIKVGGVTVYTGTS